ncbi:hypothetical protein C8J57DRAFT_1229636 [Mycena rebaudengoi]|nr:hypothetical protein C8J57DRAFT_1229636 [Mycena rebaudengoi]
MQCDAAPRNALLSTWIELITAIRGPVTESDCGRLGRSHLSSFSSRIPQLQTTSRPSIGKKKDRSIKNKAQRGREFWQDEEKPKKRRKGAAREAHFMRNSHPPRRNPMHTTVRFHNEARRAGKTPAPRPTAIARNEERTTERTEPAPLARAKLTELAAPRGTSCAKSATPARSGGRRMPKHWILGRVHVGLECIRINPDIWIVQTKEWMANIFISQDLDVVRIVRDTKIGRKKGPICD